MTYYPTNFYPNYNYNNQPYSNASAQIPMPISTLQGKIVDGEDMVKGTDVPIGGYGIFPRADLGEVYIKTWNNNGTTSIITYQPIEKKEKEDGPNKEDELKEALLEKINSLETKIDSFISAKTKETSASGATIVKRKEF